MLKTGLPYFLLALTGMLPVTPQPSVLWTADLGRGLYKENMLYADTGTAEQETLVMSVKASAIYVRVTVEQKTACTFSSSIDEKKFTPAPASFRATPGKWIGARAGLFCSRDKMNDSGYVAVDWFRVEALK